MSNCAKCDCPLMCLKGEVRRLCVRCLAVQWKRARIKKAAKRAALPKPTERICSVCGDPFPSPPDRALRKCAACKKVRKRAKTKRYSDAHREQIRIKSRQQYLSNPGLYRQKSKRYYEAHREQVLAKKRERDGVVATTKLGMMR